MDMKKRRDLQLAYIADETIMEEQRRCSKNFFANYNCTIIDVAKVKIGDNSRLEKARRDRSHARFFSYAKPVSRLQSGFLQ